MNGSAEMIEAVKNGDVPGVRRLLDEDPDLTRATDNHQKTPLHWAAEHDQLEISRMLLQAGAEVEAVTSWGATPFDWAATMGSTKVADLLLAHGAQGMNVVAAASLGKLDLVRTLVDSGTPLVGRRAVPATPNDDWVADSAAKKGDVISDAFYGACRNGHTAVAAFLLERAANINAKGVFGGTALHWAAINGHKDTVAFLVAHCADLTIRDDRFDATPQEWAIEGGHSEIREMLRPNVSK